jgi:amino acid transporter
VAASTLAPTSAASARRTSAGRRRRRRSWRTWLIGRPLATADAEHETIGKAVGLAVFSSDNLSSTAYATEEILLILAAAGVAAFHAALPISIAIAVLIVIVAVSYHQTIRAYPNAGGAYIVARDNLGELAAQFAGAALLTDYVLTVAVSVSAGVAQIASAVPELFPYRVVVAVSVVLAIMVVNLRGTRESGVVFAVPTYLFLVVIGAAVLLGLVRYASGTLGTVVDPPPLAQEGPLHVLSLFLLLHAFSSGTTALTGMEAIANGVTAFREPRARNAGVTLVWMVVLVAGLFVGLTFLAVHIGTVPAVTETVISQLARTVFGGRGVLYLIAVGATTLILFLAANTAFNGFPRLGALQAADGFLPRQLTYRGSRLVYSRGILVLAVAASLLIVAFQARVTSLIPLYCIGVFLSFTLSQAGMTLRWWKVGRLAPGQATVERASVLRHESAWLPKMVLNGFGAVCTACVVVVFAVTKFTSGAWIVVMLMPLLVLLFFAIHRHYRDLSTGLSLDDYGAPPRVHRQRILVPVSSVHRGTLAALRYARSLSDDVTAIHVSSDPEGVARMREEWERWGDGVRLVVLESPYRLLLEPLLDYIEVVAAQRQRDEVLTIVVPQFVPYRSWHNLLHAQTAVFLRMALLFRPGIVITSVPYQIRQSLVEERSA